MKRIVVIYFSFFLALQAAAQSDYQKVIDLSGVWKFSIGDNMRWADPAFNDTNWERIYVPSAWESEGFNGYDGYAWYRLKLEFRNINDASNLYLFLGYIDDVDQVYFNGQLIGFTGSFPPDFYTAYESDRRYHIPNELINKEGHNVIAVRVFDTVLDGGIISGNVGIFMKRGEAARALFMEGIWKFREGDSQVWKEKDYDDSAWSKVIVPGWWHSMKKTHFEGEAWYRKEFVLPSNLANSKEDLVLVLGKIDDFDETYLNGKLIGVTDDGRGYGSSFSYQKYRLYVLLPEYLDKTGKNVIAVRVRDIGGNAGIYEGPVAIVPYSMVSTLIHR